MRNFKRILDILKEGDLSKDRQRLNGLRKELKYKIEKYKKTKDDIKKQFLGKMIDELGDEIYELTMKLSDETLKNVRNQV